MQRIFLALIFLAFYSGANAQWQVLNGPFGTGIGFLDVTDSVIYAGGRFQTSEFFLSNDDGDHWESINSGLPAQAEVGEFAVCDSLIFAITGGGGFYKANTSDYLWSEAGSGLPASTQAYRIMEHDSMLFLSTNHGIYVSWDSGNTWHLKNNGLSETCLTLMTIQEDRIFIGTCYGDIYYSEDNGDSWVGYNTSSLPAISISSLIKMDSIMVVGTSYAIYRTTDQGNTWLKVTSAPALCDVSDLVRDSLFIYASTYGQGILRSADHGESWAPADSGLTFLTVYDLAPGNGFLMAGTMGGIYKSFDHGNSWTVSNDGLSNTSIAGLVYNGNSLYAGSYMGVSRSYDNGNSWKLVLAPFQVQGEGYVDCLYYHDSMLYAGTFCNGFGCAGLFRSGDDGNTWEQVNNGLIYTDITVINSKDSLLFVGTIGGLFRSDNKGDTWSSVFDGQTIYDIACSKDSIFIACYPGVYCSTDNGDSWTQVNTGLDHPWFFSLNSSGSRLFGGASYLYRSAIHPVAWEKITRGVILPASIKDITSNDSLVFFGDSRGVYVSSNNGDQWFLSDSGFPEPIFVQSLLLRGSILYAGTYHGIWKRPISEMYVLEANPDTMILEFEQSSIARLFIHSNAHWSLEGDFPGWLSTDILSGTGSDTVTFIALENNHSELPRSASFQLVSPSTQALPVTVIQKPFRGFLAVSKDSLTLDCPSGSLDTLYITSNTDWLIDGSFPVWLETNQITGNGNDTVIFRALEKNPTEQTRRTELEITAFQAPLVNISVTQKGKQAGTGEANIETVRVYPVPCRGSFYVESQLPVVQITVFGSDGTVLETKKGIAGKLREKFMINNTGILFIRIQTLNQAFMRKVVSF